MKILIDNGHGNNTAGKRSPDGRLMEWEYNRIIAKEVVKRLKQQGYDADLIVTEDKDISLTERVNRVNTWCNKLGTANVVFVSIHVNAAPGSGWSTARGWVPYVAPNASAKSKELAQIFYDYAIKYKLQGNRSMPKEHYQIGNFTVIVKTKCPAVLTENLFQNNKEDVDYLLSDEGKNTIVELHVNGLKDYVKKYGTPPTSSENNCTCVCHK